MQAIKRAIKYEEKTYKTRKEIIKECIRDLERERTRKEESRWKRKRRVFRKSKNEKGTDKK